MKKSYDEIAKETQAFLKYIKKHYPDKEISEYTRLVTQLEEFLAYGVWEEWNEG